VSEVPHGNVSKVIRRAAPEAFEWEGVPLEPYKPTTETYRAVTRRELVGKRGESPRFHVRYFEIGPGGFTTYERHEHEHVVHVLRGRGEAHIAGVVHPLEPGDVVYVAPKDPHQFRARKGSVEPFGFLCIVNSERDRPEPLDGWGVCDVCV
jgi:quercetin dioxygenase-like cupin family protein